MYSTATSMPHSRCASSTFAPEPAEPMTRQPRSFANWPAALPTAPAAPEMKMVSPALTSTRLSPAQAVMPVDPSAPRYTDSG